jgi:zinc transport system substrate-binding protein
MKQILPLLAIITLLSCHRNQSDSGTTKTITVSIAPFKYFVEAIGGNDFKVNVMVPPGANPHIYEPYPRQIQRLRISEAYISNGFLGFELTWLDRFYEMNTNMIRMSPVDKIDLIASDNEHGGDHSERADPHYWVSPKSARIIAGSVKVLLIQLNPGKKEEYESNLSTLMLKIDQADRKATSFFSEYPGSAFMIYHPNLAYIAKDYGLEEIPVEYEGKEPSPSRLKGLIDIAGREHLKTIFVQREYDSKNAREIAREIGARIRIIDPLSGNWFDSTMDIINALHDSFRESHLN